MIEIHFPVLAFIDKRTTDGRLLHPPTTILPWRKLPLPIMLLDDNDHVGCVGALTHIEYDRHRLWGHGHLDPIVTDPGVPYPISDDKLYWPAVDLDGSVLDCYMGRRHRWSLRKTPMADVLQWKIVGVTLITRPPAWPDIPPVKLVDTVGRGDYR